MRAWVAALALLLPAGLALAQTTLPLATLPQATLTQATLPQATLPQATLTQATLPQATLRPAMLAQATLPNATLPNATLVQATLPQVVRPTDGPTDDAPDGPAVPLSNGSLYGTPPATPHAATAPSAPQPASPAPSASAPPAPPPGLPLNTAWQPRDGVDLKALDKVNARSLTLSGRVGQAVKYATLTIQVRACLVRPPDQAADSAAYLDITDSRQNQPAFHGWMFSGEPAVAMLEHPIYDVRVSGCRA